MHGHPNVIKKGGTVSLLQIIIPTLFQTEYKA